jgi:hypothetical protein
MSTSIECHGSPRGDQRPNSSPGVRELYHNLRVYVTSCVVMHDAHNEHSRLGNSRRRQTRPQAAVLPPSRT